MISATVTWLQSCHGPARVEEAADAPGDRGPGDGAVRHPRLRPRDRRRGGRGGRRLRKTVFNYFPTKEDLFFDEIPQREAALVGGVRGRKPGESILAALRTHAARRSARRLCSPGFATFARIIEESPALQAKELEVMARFTQVLTDAIQSELRVDERDARIAAEPAGQRAPAVLPGRPQAGARGQARPGRGPAPARRPRARLPAPRARAR